MTDLQQAVPSVRSAGRGFRAYSAKHLDMLAQRAGLPAEQRLAIRAVATVLPFRTNSYVIENLIDWDAAPDDPIYRLVFPQPDMLPAADVRRLADMIGSGAPEAGLRAAAHEIRMRLNPHPAGQLLLNAPILRGRPLPGLQHKYQETVLFFPRQGQTCHAYCSYCFRWAQFVDEPDLKMATDDVGALVAYLGEHPEVTSVLITGGDPMIMGEAVLRRYLAPLIDPVNGLDHLESIRIGTKSLAYWPQRFISDPDADATLRLFGEVVASGRTLAVMAHFSHPRELEPPVLAEAVRRIRGTGAVIRTQAPLIRSINDDPEAWRAMWRTQVRMGMVPYYMFVERDTGPQDYFAVPLARGFEIFREAYQGVSGLGRTVRGPSMSATPGKVCVDGVTEVAGSKVFVLRMIQARDPQLVGTPFFARFDAAACWLTDLEPVFASRFPYEPARYEAVPDELPGLWSTAPDEPDELMVPAILMNLTILARAPPSVHRPHGAEASAGMLPIMELNGTSAVVSGGASGLGEATARVLAAAGATVVIADLNENRGKLVADDIDGLFARTDVTDEASVQAAVDAATSTGSPLRVAVSCAGIGWAARTVSRDGTPHDLASYQKVIAVNLIGTFNLMRLAAAAMAKTVPADADGQRGVIINTSSVAGIEGQTGQIAYSASKGGMIGMTVPAARDLSAIGVRVNTICPGIIDTPIYGVSENAEEFKARLVAPVVFPKRMGRPDEFGHLVRVLIENDYMNAEVVRFDGGIRFQPK